MRRALVLTEESARHPFRAAQPPHVFHGDDAADAHVSLSDLRRFAQVYCAGLVAVGLFIA